MPEDVQSGCAVTVSWWSPRYSNGNARFVLWIKSDVPHGQIAGQIRELDNGQSFSLGGGKTDEAGSFRLTDVAPPNVAGDADVLVQIDGDHEVECSYPTTLPPVSN